MNTRKYIDELDGKLNIVGTNICKIREKLNMSRQSLSDKLILMGIDISSQSIFDIEKGTRTVIDYELCAIAKVLNTTSDELMKEFNEYLNTL